MKHTHSEGYREKKTGKIVITYAAPPCAACEADNQAFERILKRDLDYKLGDRISKMASFRAYAQRWPYDMYRPFISYEGLQESGFEQPDMIDLEAEYISDEAVKEFKSSLSDLQLEMVAKYEQGYKTKEIYFDYGYKNTGGLRYHKFIMRRKHRQLASQISDADAGVPSVGSE